MLLEGKRDLRNVQEDLKILEKYELVPKKGEQMLRIHRGGGLAI